MSFDTQSPLGNEEQQDAVQPEAQASGFATLGLAPEILRSVTEAGYTEPTDVQAQAIPAAINNFKGQVFRGVINNGKNAPSTTRYPTEFGPAVNKLLSDRKPSYDEVIESLAVELRSVANDNDNVSSYFSSYASSVYSSATSFISQWTGKNGVYAPATSASGGNPGTGTGTATATANSALSTCASKCNCNEDGCTPDSPGCCGDGTCDSNC